MSLLESLGNAVSRAAGDAADKVAIEYAENKIKDYTGSKIDIVIKDVPADRAEWVRKTGINSLCTEDTWTFLENNEYNKRKVELWKERNIKTIVMTVNEKPDPKEIPDWTCCWMDWKKGSDTVTITWLPYAFSWSSPEHYWESGRKQWWLLGDWFVFVLQLYQLPGKCFYKSDWLDNFEDVDPDGFLPTSTKKFRRWFEFRHWVIYWYATDSWGWNYQWTDKPPKSANGLDFDLSNVLKLPSMPSMPKMPRLPSLPGMPSMPSMPSLSMPSMPSLSAPSLSAPSLSMPSMGSLPSLPEKKKRPQGRWGCHGMIEMAGMKVKANGKKLVLSNITITHFWETKTGGTDCETKEHQKLELECTNEEQAKSWADSLKEGGAEEGEQGCGCSIA